MSFNVGFTTNDDTPLNQIHGLVIVINLTVLLRFSTYGYNTRLVSVLFIIYGISWAYTEPAMIYHVNTLYSKFPHRNLRWKASKPQYST